MHGVAFVGPDPKHHVQASTLKWLSRQHSTDQSVKCRARRAKLYAETRENKSGHRGRFAITSDGGKLYPTYELNAHDVTQATIVENRLFQKRRKSPKIEKRDDA